MSVANEAFVSLDPDLLLAVHDAQLAEHGGAAGVKGSEPFESAHARPRNVANCDQPDATGLAASYGIGIARNHPFADGNKRTAFVAVELVLALNGWRLEANDTDCVMTMLAVAEGDLDEAAFAAWLRDDVQARSLGSLTVEAFARWLRPALKPSHTAGGHEKPRRSGVVGGAASAG